jgi:hypothetical protein
MERILSKSGEHRSRRLWKIIHTLFAWIECSWNMVDYSYLPRFDWNRMIYIELTLLWSYPMGFVFTWHWWTKRGNIKHFLCIYDDFTGRNMIDFFLIFDEWTKWNMNDSSWITVNTWSICSNWYTLCAYDAIKYWDDMADQWISLWSD